MGGRKGKKKKNKALTTQWELGDTWKFGTEGPIGPSVPRSKVSVFSRLMYISRRREKKDCQRSYHHQSVGILGL